jgi:uncharacterized protein
MSLLVNLRHLEAHSLLLEGELPIAELDIDPRDEVIQLARPLEYELEVQNLDGGLLVQGCLSLGLECQCVRCLKVFKYALKIDPWTSHLPLEGEDAVPVVNDCVDLTPWMREDILLELPQHPLCARDCNGLRKAPLGPSKTLRSPGPSEEGSPAWKALNKLKL